MAAVSAGTDKVLAGISLPRDTVVHNIKATISIGPQAGAQGVPLDRVLPYAVEAWVLPIYDPDQTTSMDNVWDLNVPKDSDSDTLDLDTSNADATPFWEPGELDLEAVFDIGQRPERMFHRHRLMTVARNAIAVYQDNQTPFDVLTQLGDAFDIHINKKFKVHEPSVFLIGCAVPAGDDTTSTLEAILGEPEWGQVQYMSHMLERAMLNSLGVTEAGAETPYVEATGLLKKHLDPDVLESVAGTLGSQTLQAVGEMMVDHSVVGEFGRQQITTGR